jgi:oligopeptide/dipeptide ABC transporter ATP-binding protein
VSASIRSTDQAAAEDTDVLVSAQHLVRHYPVGGGVVRAVDGVSFDVHRSETFGLVGESGSGKSTVARLLLALEPPTAGRVVIAGKDLATLSRSELRRQRQHMQIVFQDPFSALNRRKTVEQIVGLPLQVHVGLRGERSAARVRELLSLVGLRPELAGRYPHQMSGGQCQRVGIARALALEPDFVVLDEAVSAVDVSIRAQLLNLLRDLQARLSLTYLFVSHDLAVVRYMSHTVAVMYHGKIVESGARDRLFGNPLHPYTHSLMKAIPVPDPERERASARMRVGKADEAEVVVETGCRFRARCPLGALSPRCATEEPELVQVAPDHRVACHFPQSPESVLHRIGGIGGTAGAVGQDVAPPVLVGENTGQR